jgi:hypothetical protein
MAEKIDGTNEDDILAGGPGSQIIDSKDGDDVLAGGSFQFHPRTGERIYDEYGNPVVNQTGGRDSDIFKFSFEVEEGGGEPITLDTSPKDEGGVGSPPTLLALIKHT